MTVTAAKDKWILKKRLKRFFNPESKTRQGLCDFLDALSDKVDVYIYGGVIRDIALYGVECFKSDIDIVFIGAESALDAIWANYGAQRNNFGGHRLTVGHWQVDIWPAESTWAFREGYQSFESIESMLDTTITNWDAILYQWKVEKIICKEDYFKDLSSYYLDVVLDKNPNMLGMCTRVMRFCGGKAAAREVSPRVALLLKQALDNYSKQTLLEYEEQSFNDRYLESAYERLVENVTRHQEDLFPKEMGLHHTRAMF